MRWRRWVLGVMLASGLLLSGCASHRVSCGGWLQPINAPAGIPQSESQGEADSLPRSPESGDE